MKNLFFVLTSFSIVACITYLPGCDNSNPAVNDKNVREGQALAQQYCGSCHKLPDPSLLNKSTWAGHVLPKMAQYFGFTPFASDYISVADTAGVMTLDQWRNVIRYYVALAPEGNLERPELAVNIESGLPGFKVEMPSTGIANPATTMVVMEPRDRKLYFGDGQTEFVYSLVGNELVDSIKFGIGVSHFAIFDSLSYGLYMGVLHPSDVQLGGLKVIKVNQKRVAMTIDTLQRPVHATYWNIAGDPSREVIISEFGNNTGELAWFEENGTGFTKHVLKSAPGAVKTEIYDFNKDSLPDILALFAQGDEGMFIFYNQGSGKFIEKRVLRFLPTHGSNYFELADFNNDGFPDILASNGDNGDYPPILKPYHGIRIFINNGQNEFSEKLFLPVNGVGKVMARDFDSDGDLDLASISYFPDYQNTPEESFIYWKNNGALEFRPFSIAEATSGRWLTMDAGDLDADGDLDIVLGNAKFPLGAVPPAMMKKWNDYSPSILILRNLLK